MRNIEYEAESFYSFYRKFLGLRKSQKILPEI